MSGGAAVEVHGLVKRYRARVALDGVELVVREGSVFGLVGPNGAGKTTLLAILAGLRRASSGSARVAYPAGEVAFLPDTPQFDPWLTAREVVDLARVLVAPESPVARVDEALRVSGLLGDANRRVGGFSRGMLQRLGLAATTVGRPRLLLLDEPCAALDPAGRREVLDLVAALAGKATVVLSTHILGDVEEVCETVGILRDGRLVFDGPLDALLAAHATAAYRVRVASPIEEAEAACAREPWVRTTERIGATELRLSVRSLAEAQRELVRVLAAAGVRVVRLEPEAPDLEQVFLELTR